MTDPIITGSWIDIAHLSPMDGIYWNRKTLAYRDEEWAVLIRHLRRDLGITLLMLQNIARGGQALYPSRHMPQLRTPNCDDPVGAIVRACRTEGVDLYLGVGGMETVEYEWGEARLLGMHYPEVGLDTFQRISEEMLDRYGSTPGFAGWYTTIEIVIRDGVFLPEFVQQVGKLTAMWRRITPDKPIISSPMFMPGAPRMVKNDDFVRGIEHTGVTIMAYQDAVGCATALGFALDGRNNEQLFADLRWAHDQTGVQLWANTEIFRFENAMTGQPLVPADFDRIAGQLRHAAPYVDRIVSYTVPGIMTSQDVCPGLGDPSTERLYQAYRGYLDAHRTMKDGHYALHAPDR